jgi:ectoine hydroxylase-related dioxygenase (phytanoyl-CoA dioxygenase family)
MAPNMSLTIADIVNERAVSTFRGDGAVPLRGVFSRDWIELLRAGVETAMANPSHRAKEYAAPGEGRFFTDHSLFNRFDAFRRFLHESPVAEIAARLLGSRKINLYNEHLLVKEPGTDKPTYWHHDRPYYRIKGDQIVGLWTPLDSVGEATGSLRYVRGSHLWGKVFRPVFIGRGEEIAAAEAFDGPVPDIDADPDAYPIVCHALEPGDCLAIHVATLHASHGNASNSARRRALSLWLAGGDVTFHRRKYNPQNYDPPGLVEGGPIDCEQFPRIWPRTAPPVGA